MLIFFTNFQTFSSFFFIIDALCISIVVFTSAVIKMDLMSYYMYEESRKFRNLDTYIAKRNHLVLNFQNLHTIIESQVLNYYILPLIVNK